MDNIKISSFHGACISVIEECGTRQKEEEKKKKVSAAFADSVAKGREEGGSGAGTL